MALLVFVYINYLKTNKNMEFAELLLHTSAVCIVNNGKYANCDMKSIERLFLNCYMLEPITSCRKLKHLIQVEASPNHNEFITRYFMELSRQTLTSEQEIQVLRVAFRTISIFNPVECRDVSFFKMIRSYMKNVSNDILLDSIDGINENYLIQDVHTNVPLYDNFFNTTEITKFKFEFGVIPFCGYRYPINNSKGMFKNLFSAKGRIGRFEFGLSFVLYLIISVSLLFFIVNYLDPYANPFNLPIPFRLPLWGLDILLILQGIKRCHDLGKSGWWIWVPIFNPVFLLIDEGEDCVNDYGTDPKRSYESQKEFGPIKMVSVID